MDRFDKIVEDFKKSISRFEEAVLKSQELKNTSEYPFYRDSAIQRFEFTFEIMWKTIKVFLEMEGIICRSPRSCIRELFSAGFISEEEARHLLKMLEDRNLTVHTYRESVAEEIFERLPSHVNILKRILTLLFSSER
ncbi:HI0074 family nucleotidyltransferase substrate-binding subunit [Desulfurobacterium crinifex]